MNDYDYDLFVIGAGSGGVRAARMAAAAGARVAIAEDRYLGGTCVNVGCVPKKLYVYASEYGHAFEDARGFGWNSDQKSDGIHNDPTQPRFDWTVLRDNKRAEIARLNGVYRTLLANAGAELIDARARITGPHSVQVNGRDVSAGKLLIATGGWPHIPAFPGSEFAISSNEVFDLEQFPRRLVIVGGGYIAVEFAGIFNGLGAEVTQLYRGPLFLRGFDEDVRRHAAQEIAGSGVDLRFDTNVTAIEKTGGELHLALTDGSHIAADAVLYATGRRPNLEGLGLDCVDVKLDDDGAIVVDREYRSSEPSIFALGDVTGGLELTPRALAEGMAFARRQFGGGGPAVDYEFIPTTVFCQPNIGTVGFTEDAARAQFGEVTVFKTSFRPLRHTLSGRQERCFMKLVVDTASDRVVGAHMVGPDAGEIMQGIAIALRAGATKALFDSTLGIHPTLAEEFVTMRDAWTGD